jgi:NADH:ubiquinone oxidoreductase subunit C
MTGGRSWPDRVRTGFSDRWGEEASVEEGFGPVSVDVPAAHWTEAVQLARDVLECRFFDWLSAVDELEDGFRVVCHLVRRRPGSVEHVLLRTLVPRNEARLESVHGLFAGALWHERETHEMFGVEFTSGGQTLELEPLLLPDSFEGHPLRKDFVLASRVAKAWPGAKEPGESDSPARSSSAGRRRTRPSGVPEPGAWGPRQPEADAGEPDA